MKTVTGLIKICNGIQASRGQFYSIGMVCNVPFLIALLLLTIGILILPTFPFISPLLFYGCYRIWRYLDSPSLAGYSTLKEVQEASQRTANSDNHNNSYDDFTEMKGALIEKEKGKDNKKAA